MGTEASPPIVLPVQCAPKIAPCPGCGKRGRRERTVTRRVRTVAYKAIAYLEITYGEYSARCGCSKAVRNTHEEVLPGAAYDDKVRDLVLDRILKDGMSVERTLGSLERESLLKLILDAVRRIRTAMGRRGQAGGGKKRGREGAKAKAAAKRRGLTVKEKAHFVFKHRHLIVKRRENLTGEGRGDLKRMPEDLPSSATSRRFADRIYRVFDTPEDWHQASGRRSALMRAPASLAVPELARAMNRLDDG
jgi:hypothetical protein